VSAASRFATAGSLAGAACDRRAGYADAEGLQPLVGRGRQHRQRDRGRDLQERGELSARDVGLLIGQDLGRLRAGLRYSDGKRDAGDAEHPERDGRQQER